MLSQPDNNIVFPEPERQQLQLPKVNLIFHFPDAAKAKRKFFIF